jgi:hypothetical protein
VLEARLVTVIGDDEPLNVAGDVEGVGVTTKDDVIPPFVPAENATEADPLLNALPDPEFVATGDVGIPAAVFGSHHPASYTSRTDVSVL